MNEIQLVVFKLNQEEYGVDIMNVKEIVPYMDPVKIPNADSFIEGIINLRGDIIPVVSLKKRFNMSETTINGQSRIIVMSLSNKTIGFIVDDASDVLTMNTCDIEEAPELVSIMDRKFIKGIGKQEERLLIMLDMEMLFTQDETIQLKAV